MELDVSIALQPVTQDHRTHLTELFLAEFINAQATGFFCQTVAKELWKTGTEITINIESVFVSQVQVDGALKKLASQSSGLLFLNLAHYPLIFGHPRQQGMYDTMQRDNFWPNGAFEVHSSVRSRIIYARNSSDAKLKGHRHLFMAIGSLDFVAMDIFIPLPKTMIGKMHVVVIIDCNPKLTRAVLNARTVTDAVAGIFFTPWIMPYCISLYLLTDNDTRFVSRVLESHCNQLDTKHLTTTAYHLQTNGYVKRYKETIVDRLSHHVANWQRYLDLFFQPLTYAYNAQIHRLANTAPFGQVLSRQSPNLTFLPPLPRYQ